MTYYLGSTGFIFPDKIIQGQYASNSIDASKINMFYKNENYGISTSNPEFSLDVNGTIKTNSALIIGSSTYTDVNLNNTSNTAYFASNLSVINETSLNSTSNSAYFASNLSVINERSLNSTSNSAFFASNLSVYSSNANSNFLLLSGGPMTGALITGGFSANNQISKFQNGNSSNDVFIESSVGTYY
jgi:hypothetical protein